MKEQSSYRFARIYHLIGFIVLCAVSVPMHFFYEWLNNNQLVGYFAPVNESIWEHLKLGRLYSGGELASLCLEKAKECKPELGFMQAFSLLLPLLW